MAGFKALPWIKKTVNKVDKVFRGEKQTETKQEYDPIEAYNAYMAEAFRLLAQDTNLPEWKRQLYRNGFEEVDAVQIELYDLYG